MKCVNFLILIYILGLLVSCESSDDDLQKAYSFTGKAQKGPFITGTNITVNELNSNLGQTGKSFTTTIFNDDGSFGLENIELNSNLVLLTANGFYFSEIYGELSSAALSLQAISDLDSKESVNVNVLTHLIKGRVENLVSTGMGFQEANEQAESEFLSFLGVTETIEVDFDNLDISEDNEYSAVLLAFSVVLQRYTGLLTVRPTLTAELTELLSNLSADFSIDGLITDQELIDQLLNNISQLNLIDIRTNIEARYANLGHSDKIQDFEKYIAKFQEKHSDNLYTDFTYPISASWSPIISPDDKVPNLLVPANTLFAPGAYTLAAITPLNSNLTIKFIGKNVDYNYQLSGPEYGWEVINEYPNGFTMNSQRQNELMIMPIYLEYNGNAVIEYYENNMDTPVLTKSISWK